MQPTRPILFPEQERKTVKIKKAVALSAAVGVALAGISFSIPANADPVSGGYSIVGSDTLQDAVNALVNGTNITGTAVRVTAGGNPVGNFDATGSTVIQLKPSGPFVARPVGSGDGVKALSRSIDGGNWARSAVPGVSAVVVGQVDLARSSSGAAATVNNGDINNATGALLYVPFGRDAVSYAIKAGSGVSSADLAAISALTTAQLTQIYTNATAQVVGSTTIVPVLPQTSSGTRKFWLKTLTGSESGAAAGVASANYTNTTLIENDATQIPAAAANTVVIIPFSAASWIAQSNGATPLNSTTGAVLGGPNGISPYTGTGSALAPNASFYSTAYGRDVYIVAPAAKVVPGVDPAQFDADLASLIDPTNPLGLTYFPSTPAGPGTSKAVKLRYGFMVPSSSTTFRTNLLS